jgi:ribulose-5-phosphate 4-epimerase/fuculose-1-phosphate aldolase
MHFQRDATSATALRPCRDDDGGLTETATNCRIPGVQVGLFHRARRLMVRTVRIQPGLVRQPAILVHVLRKRIAARALLACAAIGALQAQAPRRAESVEKLVLSNQILAMEGLVGPFGHVSVRSGPGKFLIAKHESADQVTAADVIEVDNRITPAEVQKQNLYLEIFIHSAIYARYPEIGAVVHTHAPHAVALGTLRVADNRIEPTTSPGANLGNFIPIFAETGLVRDGEKGLRIAEALQGQNGVLLRGHGTVTVGRTLEQAVLRSLYLEFESRSQMLTRAAGEPRFYTPAESDPFKETRSVDHAWHYYAERAKRRTPQAEPRK